MSYSTNTATDATDVLTNLHAFLVAEGYWTITDWATDGLGKKLVLTVDGVIFILRSLIGEELRYNDTTDIFPVIHGLYLYPATAYSGGTRWNYNTGGPVGSSSRKIPTGIFINGAVPKYHFFSFASPNVCYIVIEYAAGFYHAMGFGEIAKIGTWTGGEFAFGVDVGNADVVNQSANWIGGNATFLAGRNQAYLHLSAVDSFTGWAWGNRNQFIPGGVPTCYDQWQFSQGIAGALPIKLNSETGLIPNILYSDGGGGFRARGYLPNVHITNLKNHAAAATYTLGGDNYKMFPYYNRNDIQPLLNFSTGLQNQDKSGYFGNAIKSN